MGPYGGLSLRGGQQAALPLIGTWNLEPLSLRLTSPAGWLPRTVNQLQNPTLGNRVWATITFLEQI